MSASLCSSRELQRGSRRELLRPAGSAGRKLSPKHIEGTATHAAKLLRVAFGVFCGSAASGALFAGANFTQPLPRINPQIVTVIPVELDGVFADALR